jgi:hypothetical protein
VLRPLSTCGVKWRGQGLFARINFGDENDFDLMDAMAGRGLATDLLMTGR